MKTYCGGNNRYYETKYDNETHKLFTELRDECEPRTFKALAERLGIKYTGLFNSVRRDRITYTTKVKIQAEFKLSEDQKETLDRLVAG